MSDVLMEAKSAVQEYCDGVPGQISEVRSLVSLASAKPRSSHETVDLLYNAMHRMSGAALCMGFPFLGEELGKIEEMLAPASAPSPNDYSELLGAVAQRLALLERLKSYIKPENSSLISEMQAEVEASKAETGQKRLNYANILKQQRILFADDDVAIRMLMRHILSQLGVSKFEVFNSGQELLSAATGFEPTVIITDWRMTPVNGVELLQRIRRKQTRFASNCPVIFLSSRNSLAEVREAVGEGANHFIVKPFTIESVQRAICHVVERKTA